MDKFLNFIMMLIGVNIIVLTIYLIVGIAYQFLGAM